LPSCHFLTPEQILTPMFSDKKFGHQRICFVLPREIGQVEILDETPLPAVQATVQAYLDQQQSQPEKTP
jgi:3-dehydroquinate synthetase